MRFSKAFTHRRTRISLILNYIDTNDYCDLFNVDRISARDAFNRPAHLRLAAIGINHGAEICSRGALMSLLTAARAARDNAHAPYSGFKVGAAVRAKSGTIYAGCNVENVAYPEGTCAEAGAIAAMVAAGENDIAEVLVIAGGDIPVSPCGGCRQKLAEFADPEVVVTLATTNGDQSETTIGALLPGAFDISHMQGS